MLSKGVVPFFFRAGARLRIRAAGLPSRKALDDLIFNHQPALKRDQIIHLGGGLLLEQARNIVLIGPPGTGAATPATGSCSAPQSSGSPDSKTPTNAADCQTRSFDCAVTG